MATNEALLDLSSRMMALMERMQLTEESKVHFKALKPCIFNIEDALTLEDFLTQFEKYCATRYGSGDKEAWSAALGEFLSGEIKNAYTNMSGGGLKYSKLKALLLTRFKINPDRKELFIKQFEDIKKNSNESIDDFSLRLEKLARKAFADFEASAFNQTLRAKYMTSLSTTLRKGVRAALMREDATKLSFEDLVLLTKKVELDIDVIEIEEIKVAPSIILPIECEVDAIAKSNLSLRPNGNKKICDHCKKEGHLVISCWILHPELRQPRNATIVRNNNSPRLCFKCNQPGHFANNCPNNSVNFQPRLAIGPTTVGAIANQPTANVEKSCMGCGAAGTAFHLMKDCPVLISWFGNPTTARVNNSRVAAITQGEPEDSLN
ncbi:unnamed protein product [Rotaria socialis]|uniref:CCHC-type domain-containing protein n=1 Tax=Rotaria socialis TaxID=392032 RepID=A0A818THT6_9BILA|nr:unnamed protein product [Rotaria socialis]CAF4875085.1 unnamed protein product [Rotaria socialis]